MTRRVSIKGRVALMGLDLALWASDGGALERLGWWLYHRCSGEFFEDPANPAR
jgi:hypothetical protein